MTFAATEEIVKTWLATTTVAALVTRSDGGVNIYNAMPKTAPLPAVVLYQSVGGPISEKDLPEQFARIRFDCWAAKRSEARNIGLQITAELDNLQREGGLIVDGVYLAATTNPLMRWIPDPESDTPRYIVESLITTVA